MTRFEELCLQLATNIVAVYRACTQNQTVFVHNFHIYIYIYIYIYTVTRCDPLQSYTLSASALVVKELEKCTQITVAQVQDPRGEFVPHNEARTSSHNCCDCQVTLSKVSRTSLVKGAI